MNSDNFSTAHAEVTKLVKNFGDNLDKFHAPDYNESAVRKDYIDKFFIALGWDVNHDTQTNPYEQEVKVERNVSVAARVKKADYAFFLAPNFAQERFFVEAKRPSAVLDTPDNCFQTIRYAFSSAKAALSILTNFNELYVIDCRFRPDIDTATNHIHKKFHFTNFEDKNKFGELYYLFGREAVEDGALERYAETLPKPKGKVLQRRLFGDNYQEIDDAFLVQLEVYREELAKMFKRKNTALDSDSLTEAVQRTIDRLVFLRFLEDKLIEPSTILDKLSDELHPWKKFIARCREFDKTYNGIIFKEHPVIDRDDFAVDDKVFTGITDSLADKYSPYHFNYIPIHILGSIYERFLGSVIVATSKRATVEQKPEVRKAGGVFYTPQYIVKYIVENTIGSMLSSEAPPIDVRKGSAFPKDAPNDQRGSAADLSGGIAAENIMAADGEAELRRTSSGKAAKMTPAHVAKMRFADIACGSGSFLLGAYEYLLAWHTKYYNERATKTEAKQDGCITNDDGTFALSFEQKKEILVNNIYGVDIDRQAYEVTQLSLFLKLLEDETQGTKQQFLTGHRETMLPSLASNIVCGNALVDWDITGGDLFEQIDNEKQIKLNPMSFEQKFPEIMRNGGFDAIIGNPPWGAEFSKQASDYLSRKMQTAYSANSDSYVLFIERSLGLLRKDGELGYITPDTFLRKDNHQKLRDLIFDNYAISELIETGPVFKQVRDTWCLVFSITNQQSDGLNLIRQKQISRFIVSAEERLERFGKGIWDREELVSQKTWNTKSKVVGYLVSEPEQSIIRKLERHTVLGADLRFMISRGEEGSKFNVVSDEQGDFRLLIPADVKRYVVNQGIRVNSNTLTSTKVANLYTKPKIWIIRIQKMRWIQRIVCAFDSRTNTAGMKTLQVIVPRNGDVQDLLFLNAILSSKLINFYCINYLADDMNQSYLEKLPICSVDHTNADEKAGHDVIVRSVEQIMEAKPKLAAAATEREREFWQGKCDTLESAIDRAVYKLYDLTPDEIKLVENG